MDEKSEKSEMSQSEEKDENTCPIPEKVQSTKLYYN